MSRWNVEAFYRDEFQWCVTAVMKGQKGDGVTIQHSDAVDIVHDTFMGWLSYPESFNEKYAWNRLMCRRKDWMRNTARRCEAEGDFRMHFGEDILDKVRDDPADVSIREDMSLKILGEILTKKLDHHVQILYAHFVEGYTVSEIEIGTLPMRKDIVLRFRRVMVKKYGGD